MQDNTVHMQGPIMAPCIAPMLEHCVAGEALLPATAYVEVMMSSIRSMVHPEHHGVYALTDMRIMAPLVLSTEYTAQDMLSCIIDPSSGSIMLQSHMGDVMTQHVTASCAVGLPLDSSVKQSVIYSLIATQAACWSPPMATASIAAEHASTPSAGMFMIHPTQADASLQLGAIAAGFASLLVPVSITHACVLGDGLGVSSHGGRPTHAVTGVLERSRLHVLAPHWHLQDVGLQKKTLHARPQHVHVVDVLTCDDVHAVEPSTHVGDDDVEDADMLFDVGIEKHHTSMLQLIQELPSVKVMGGVHAHVQQAMLRCVHLEGGRVGWGVSSSSSVQGHALVGVLDEAEGGAGLYGQEQGCVLATQRVVQSLNGVVVDDVRVEAHPRGSLSNLVACPVLPEDTLGGDVVVGVGAVGLNFRDLLNVLVCGACACA